jgi:hypothetical protein
VRRFSRGRRLSPDVIHAVGSKSNSAAHADEKGATITLSI